MGVCIQKTFLFRYSCFTRVFSFHMAAKGLQSQVMSILISSDLQISSNFQKSTFLSLQYSGAFIGLLPRGVNVCPFAELVFTVSPTQGRLTDRWIGEFEANGWDYWTSFASTVAGPTQLANPTQGKLANPSHENWEAMDSHPFSNLGLQCKEGCCRLM